MVSTAPCLYTMVTDYVLEMYNETLHDWYNHIPDITPIPSQFLAFLISIVLKQTCFFFNSQTYTQNYGITMGAPSSDKLANITLYKHLQHTLPLYKGIQPILQLRLIDDIFGIFNGTLEQLKSWITFLNNSHSTIKFTIDSSVHPHNFVSSTH